MADESCGCNGGGILWFLAGLGVGAAVGVLSAASKTTALAHTRFRLSDPEL